MISKDSHKKDALVGTMVRMIRNSSIAHIARTAGLDFIMVDMEHGTHSMETFGDIAKVAKSVGLGIFVRVPELSRGYVSRVMDAGAQGVMVPMLNTEEEAKKLVEWSKYPPFGGRGFGSSSVQTNFASRGSDAGDFMRSINESSLSIAQIETEEGVDNIERIAAVDGIDVLLIGPYDLSISLGVPGDLNGDAVGSAIEKVATVAEKYGKLFGMHAGDALLERWIPRGMKVIMNDYDAGVLHHGLSAIATKFN